MVRILITSDLHFTDRVKDEHRWELFPWLRRRIEHLEVDALFVLGDVTDEKNNHSAYLVNRLVEGFSSIQVHTHIIKGNHDYTDPDDPYLNFLNAIPGVSFYKEPTLIKPGPSLMVPHGYWKEANNFKGKGMALVCCHETFRGAIASNGMKLKSNYRPRISRFSGARVISGDIHVPQKLRDVTYVGCPYPIRFGDTFKPRVLLWDDGDLSSIPRTTIKKLVADIYRPDELIEMLDDEEITAGDQVKIRLHLSNEELANWKESREEIFQIGEDEDFDIFSVELIRDDEITEVSLAGSEAALRQDPEIMLKEFAKAKELDKATLRQGLKLLEAEGV